VSGLLIFFCLVDRPWSIDVRRLGCWRLRWAAFAGRRWHASSGKCLQIFAGVVAVGLLLSRSAWSAPPTLRLDCPGLSREDASQTEARIRGTLLALDSTNLVLSLRCLEHVALAEVEVGDSRVRASASVDALGQREALLEAADAALAAVDSASKEKHAVAIDAQDKAQTPVPAPSKERAAEAKATTRPGPPPESAFVVRGGREGAPEEPPALPTPPAVFEVSAAAIAEDWWSAWAFGGSVGLQRSVAAHAYGLSVGYLTSASSEGFRAAEWHASASFGLHPAWAYGLRASLALGVSALIANPKNGLATAGTTTSNAAFADLLVARPFWSSMVALVPGAGIRAFSAARHVNVDGDERLSLAKPVFFATLGVLYRVP
jgi:hypothetical protein